MAETITVRGDNITLDLLLWRRYGIAGQSLVEEALERNRGLAAEGPVLPQGTVVVLPDLPTPATPAERKIITLFG